MRTIKGLLEVLRDNSQHFEYGICNMTAILRLECIISENEELEIDDYVDKNAPPPYDFMSYSWPCGEWQPRLEWINEQIKLLSNEQ